MNATAAAKMTTTLTRIRPLRQASHTFMRVDHCMHFFAGLFSTLARAEEKQEPFTKGFEECSASMAQTRLALFKPPVAARGGGGGGGVQDFCVLLIYINNQPNKQKTGVLSLALSTR